MKLKKNQLNEDLDCTEIKEPQEDPFRCGCGIYHKVNYKYLKRLLNLWIGRPWVTLHQKWSKKFDRRTRLGQATWREIDRMVVEGSLYKNETVFRWDDWAEFYTDPNGIIQECTSRYRRNRRKQPKILEEIKLDDFNKIELVEGIWYHIRCKKTIEPYMAYSALERRYVPTGKFFEQWKQVFKNQLSKENLKKFGLKNGVKKIVPIPRRKLARMRKAA